MHSQTGNRPSYTGVFLRRLEALRYILRLELKFDKRLGNTAAEVLSNFKAIRWFKLQIRRLRDTPSYDHVGYWKAPHVVERHKSHGAICHFSHVPCMQTMMIIGSHVDNHPKPSMYSRMYGKIRANTSRKHHMLCMCPLLAPGYRQSPLPRHIV